MKNEQQMRIERENVEIKQSIEGVLVKKSSVGVGREKWFFLSKQNVFAA